MSSLAGVRQGVTSFLFNDTDDVAPIPTLRLSHAQTAGLLIVLSLLMLVPVIFFNYLYPLSPARIERPATALMQDLGLWRWFGQRQPDALSNRYTLAALIVLGSLISFATYGLAIWLVWKKAATRTLLAIAIGGSLVFMLLSLWSLPNFNTDIYDHILRARTVSEYGENPYIVEPAAFPQDPIYPYASPKFIHMTTDKLPTWTLISAAGAEVAGDDATTNLLAARGLITLFNIGSVVLIVLILRRWNPLYAVAGAIAYGWNPANIILTQGKPDPVMVFFLLLGVLMLTMQRYRWMVILLAIATLTKLIPLPLVGIYFLRELKARRWKELVIGGLLFVVVVVALYLPFVNTLDVAQDQLRLLRRGGSGLPGGIRYVFVAGFAMLVLYLGLRRADSDRKMLWSWALALLYFALFLTKIVNSWYHLTFIAVAAVAIRWPMVLMMLAITWSSFLLNTWRAASTPEFTLPSPEIPRLVMYLSLPALALLGSAALVAVRIRRSNQLHNA